MGDRPVKGATPAVDPGRRASLAKIHVARKLLRLSDELYRAIIARVTGGKRSSAQLDAAERGRLLDELRRLGFQPRAPHSSADAERRQLGNRASPEAGTAQVLGKRPRVSARLGFKFGAVQARRIRVLWRRLARLGQLRDPSERGLRHFVRAQSGCDAVEWLNPRDASVVIEALKSWCSRIE